MKSALLLTLLPLLPFSLGGLVPASVHRRQSPAVLLAAETLDPLLLRPGLFSRISYCSPGAVQSWQCGPPCEATPGVRVVQAGGDNGLVPRYFIAHDPETESVVVAHQGTDKDNILSVINNLKLGLVDLDPALFPGAPPSSDIKVHDGFQDTFLRTANEILDGVRRVLTEESLSRVIITGHSLGAAVATLDAVMLKQNLDPSVTIDAVVFGLPMGGNQAWANFVDAQLGGSFKHVSNQNDPVPRLPGNFLGFHHPGGEIHIEAVDGNGDAVEVLECPGQENKECSAGNSLLQTDLANHSGPYLRNVSFGSAACPL